MKLRITQQLHESIDGIQFSGFRPGYVYEVGTTIGNYLLAVDAGEPVAEDAPYIVLAPEYQLFYPEPHVPSQPPKAYSPSRDDHRDIAADRAPRCYSSPRTSNRVRRLRLHTRINDVTARVSALAREVTRIKRELERLQYAI